MDALDDDDPAASLPAVLSWSYRALSRTQRDLFRGGAGGLNHVTEGVVIATGLPRDDVVRPSLRALE
jgi:hypothetical protein